MVPGDDHGADQFALRSGCRYKGCVGETADLSQPGLEGVHKVQVALDGVFRLEGVGGCKTGVAGGCLVDFWVVLHCTGAQGVEAQINGVVLLG